jgi:hypothetical protein
VRDRRGARGSPTVGRRSGRCSEEQMAVSFHRLPRKGICGLVGQEDGGMQRRLHLFDRLVSPEISERPVDRCCDSFLPAMQNTLQGAYQLAAVCKKAGQGQQSNKCRRASFRNRPPLLSSFSFFEFSVLKRPKLLECARQVLTRPGHAHLYGVEEKFL